MSQKSPFVGNCVRHGEFYLDAPDSPCPSCEDGPAEDLELEPDPAGVKDDKVVLVPQLIKPCGYRAGRLKGLKLVAAPPHVCAFLCECSIGEMVPLSRAAQVLIELATFGYQVEIRKPEIEEVGVMEFSIGAGEITGKEE